MVDIPNTVKEETVRKGVFKTVSGEVGHVVVGEREEMIVGNLAGEDAITLELAHDGTRITDNFAGTLFGRFLGLGIAVHEVDTMFEGRVGNIMEEAGEGLLFVVGEAPDNESDADAVSEDGISMFEAVKAAILDAINHTNAAETLHLGGGDVT